MQNAMVSIYGTKLYYERYYKADNNYIQSLLIDQWLDKDKLIENQLYALKNLLDYSTSNIEYYRRIFDLYAIDTNKITNIDDIRNIPVLEKENIRNNVIDLIDKNIKTGQLVKLNTSGTTGKSLAIYVDLDSRRKAYAYFTRYHSWAGLTNSRNNVTLGGRAIVPQEQKSKIFWRYNAAMNNHLFSTYHMSDENLPYYVEKIIKIRPKFIEAYPSAIYVLAKYMENNGITGINPRAVLTSGETLFDYQRKIVERVFKCKVFDQYGCTEQALFVSQCEKGTYHVHPEYGIVELLDDDNLPIVVAGQPGKVVCTSFMNKAMPLIRYNLGDIAEWGEKSCECGRNFPIIKKIYGRQDDYIITSDGKKIGRLDPILKSVDSVKLAQIVQTDISSIIIRIVPGSNFCKFDSDIIVKELKKRIGYNMHVHVDIVDNIESTANGKFKAVISELGRKV